MNFANLTKSLLHGKNKKTVVFPKTEKQPVARPRKKLNPLKMVFGGIFSIFFIFVCLVQHGSLSVVGNDDVAKLLSSQWLPIILFWAALGCFLPKGRRRASDNSVTTSSVGFSKRTVAAFVFVLIAVPATVLAGMYLLQDKKYYFISILVMLETLIPFLITFEGRKPSARELVIISGLCGLAVVGRAAFSILPQFKPMVAVVIIAGICFGGEAGFLVGAVAAFVSNFFAGQGSWTPWQMIACGMVGFVGGILFAPGRLPRSKFVLSVFGFAATFLIYGIIVDSQFVLLMLSEMSAEAIVGAYVMGIPFNLIHGVSTAMFLWFISEPLIEKLERVKIKYGLLNK